MLQFYFLSILFNTATGLVLLVTDGEDRVSEGKLPVFVFDETFRLVLGILTAVTGFFKLLTAVRGDIPVIGDLLPAIAGLAGGFALLYEFYKTRSTVEDVQLPPVVQRIVEGKRYVGIVSIIAAACHFLFPTVIFL